MHRDPATLRGSQTHRAAMRPTVRPSSLLNVRRCMFFGRIGGSPHSRAKPIHKPPGTFPITFIRLEIARTVGQAQGMARTKMRVVGAKEKIEIAHHLAALGAFDGPSHATHAHSAAGELKCLSDWFSVDLKVQV